MIVVEISHRQDPGSVPQGGKCIFVVAAELAYKGNAAEEHSLKYLRMFPEMFCNIFRNDLQQSPECLETFPGMFYDFTRNIWQHSPECFVTFPGTFEDIHWNVWGHSLE